eukprot:11207058-Lingulodinium_polyedra.AAC.1
MAISDSSGGLNSAVSSELFNAMPVVPTTSPSMNDGASRDIAGDGATSSSSQVSPLVERERDRRFPVHHRMNTPSPVSMRP